MLGVVAGTLGTLGTSPRGRRGRELSAPSSSRHCHLAAPAEGTEGTLGTVGTMGTVGTGTGHGWDFCRTPAPRWQLLGTPRGSGKLRLRAEAEPEPRSAARRLPTPSSSSRTPRARRVPGPDPAAGRILPPALPEFGAWEWAGAARLVPAPELRMPGAAPKGHRHRPGCCSWCPGSAKPLTPHPQPFEKLLLG